MSFHVHEQMLKIMFLLPCSHVFNVNLNFLSELFVMNLLQQLFYLSYLLSFQLIISIFLLEIFNYYERFEVSYFFQGRFELRVVIIWGRHELLHERFLKASRLTSVNCRLRERLSVEQLFVVFKLIHMEFPIMLLVFWRRVLLSHSPIESYSHEY